MSLVWTRDLSVGVESIDVQHQELFRRLNALLVAIGDQRQEQEVLVTLAFLGDYVVSHLADEEQLMREIGYPELPVHLAEHGQLSGAFGRLSTRFARHGIDAVLAKDVESELCDWLVRHVQRTDRALGEWLSRRGQDGAHG
jgi:hemerythrin